MWHRIKGPQCDMIHLPVCFAAATFACGVHEVALILLALLPMTSPALHCARTSLHMYFTLHGPSDYPESGPNAITGAGYCTIQLCTCMPLHYVAALQVAP
jgi:hypothetical protein